MAEKQARTNARTWRKKAVQIVAVHRSANGATRANMVATTATSATAAILRAIRQEAPATTRFYLVGPTEAGATTVREALREAAARFQQDPASGLPGKAKPRKNAPEKSAANFYICAREASGTEPSDDAHTRERARTKQARAKLRRAELSKKPAKPKARARKSERPKRPPCSLLLSKNSDPKKLNKKLHSATTTM